VIAGLFERRVMTKIEMRFMWMPGIMPEIVPARVPSKRARIRGSILV